MWAKLDEILRRYQEMERQLSNPAVIADSLRAGQLAKEHGLLARVARPYLEYRRLEEELAQAERLAIAEKDPELRAYAEEEVHNLRRKLAQLRQHLEELLLVDPEEDRDSVILEIRAGTGGEEAALFAADLFRMYEKYAAARGWKMEVLDFNATDLGGFKEIICSISGENVYRELRYESGGHRVQRVPKTEQQGRIHTSAATVAVLAEPEEIEIEIKPDEVRIDTFASGGPGGQHQNKTQSGVRIVHLPTGIVAECRNERSQHKNKATAWRMLRAKLYQHFAQQKEAERAQQRRSLIGTGDRSDRIRTYNFPQNRVTDHRIGLTLYKLDAIMNGELQELIRALIEYDRRQQFEQLSLEKVVASSAHGE
ncbi:Peptide chain release factor 1 [bacterium HR36]|uniref:Peptide chain release factor 1 n=1 Tax=uncultured Planctomycetota bacterium TaxID=120965 RepID=H5SC11_9BACT|nr:peptide chain release factor RF-1 [uncultured Planctomycetota bacterium]GBD35816.1 Peptide chain release factor 1 [bacterium HR36]